MKAEDAYSLNPGENVIKLTDVELGIIIRSLDFAQIEAENQKVRYIQRSAMSLYNDVVSAELGRQISTISDLKKALENQEKNL